jgi:hypothetical protein
MSDNVTKFPQKTRPRYWDSAALVASAPHPDFTGGEIRWYRVTKNGWEGFNLRVTRRGRNGEIVEWDAATFNRAGWEAVNSMRKEAE